MTDATGSKKNKERSPNFPFIALEPAIQRAQILFSHERRGAAPVAAVAKHWGYSDTSSGFKQTVAALKSYGLLIDEPGAGGRTVRLTDKALRILLDQRPDSSERTELIKQAALNPSVASEIFTRWPDGLPSDHTLTHYLMFDRGFQQETAMRAVKILRANDAFAKVSQEELDVTGAATADQFDNPLQQQVLVEPMYTGGGGSTLARTAYDLAAPHPSVTPQPPQARSEKIIDPNGMDVTISFGGEPSQETYEFPADYIALRLRQFERKAMRGSVPAPQQQDIDRE
jgi:hypothetical protein